MNRLAMGSVIATVLGVGAGIVLACSGDQTGPLPPPPSGLVPPPPGLLVRVHSPNSTDGAVLFELRGPGIKPVTGSPQGTQVYTELVGDTLLRAVVVGPIDNGLTMFVPLRERAQASNYRASVVEVAERNGVMRSNIGGYSIGLEAQ